MYSNAHVVIIFLIIICALIFILIKGIDEEKSFYKFMYDC